MSKDQSQSVAFIKFSSFNPATKTVTPSSTPHVASGLSIQSRLQSHSTGPLDPTLASLLASFGSYLPAGPPPTPYHGSSGLPHPPQPPFPAPSPVPANEYFAIDPRLLELGPPPDHVAPMHSTFEPRPSNPPPRLALPAGLPPPSIEANPEDPYQDDCIMFASSLSALLDEDGIPTETYGKLTSDIGPTAYRVPVHGSNLSTLPESLVTVKGAGQFKCQYQNPHLGVTCTEMRKRGRDWLRHFKKHAQDEDKAVCSGKLLMDHTVALRYPQATVVRQCSLCGIQISSIGQRLDMVWARHVKLVHAEIRENIKSLCRKKFLRDNPRRKAVKAPPKKKKTATRKTVKAPPKQTKITTRSQSSGASKKKRRSTRNR